MGPRVDAALGASARATGARASGTSSASVQVTLTLTVESALSMVVETVDVGDPAACDGGSARAELVQTPGGGSIHFGSGIVPHLPSTVTNGCAVRTEGEEPGLHLIAALRSTLQVAGFPAASVHIARGEAPGEYALGQFPAESVRFTPGNSSVSQWRRGGAGFAVPAGRGSPLVRGAVSGDRAEGQIALFVPDGAPPGAYRASVLLSMTAE